MKARSKAQKLALKRGRPKLAATIHSREPNGRLSRRRERTVQVEHETISTVAATRMRHFGLSDITKAADPRHGYVLGRMFMDGAVTWGQHEAGKRYAEDMARYYGLSGIPFPSAASSFLFQVKPWEERADKQSLRTSAPSPDERVESAKNARHHMTILRDKLLACGDINTGRKVEHTVKAVCVEDMDHLRRLNPAMLAFLKRGLNALKDHYHIREPGGSFP